MTRPSEKKGKLAKNTYDHKHVFFSDTKYQIRVFVPFEFVSI